MVKDPDDTVGLLAYALFKQAIREDAENGTHNQSSSRNPPNTTVQVFRESAERRLLQFSDRVMEELGPGILDQNTIAAIKGSEAAIIQKIDSNTSLKAAVISNIAAWAITLGFTVLVITSVYLPNWQADMAAQIKRAYEQSPPKPAG